MSEPRTLVESLARASGTAEGVTFLVRDAERFVSYREIRERAARAAGALRRWGIRRGDRVAVAVPTGLPFYESFFGVLLAGAVPVSIAPPFRFGDHVLHRETTAAMMRASGARRLLTDRAGQRRLGELGACAVETLVPDARVEQRPDADELALVQFSSGTTGDPKPIALTHRQVLANVRSIVGALFEAYPPEDGYRHGGVSWLPLHHDMGLVGAVFTALDHPGPLALLKPEEFVARPSRWLRAISRFRATISAAPNFAYELAAERVREEELEGVDLSSWLFALDGAETVMPSTLRRFFRRFEPYGLRRASLMPVYGLAEAALAVSFSVPRRAFRVRRFARTSLAAGRRPEETPDGVELVSCGRPLAGLEVRIEGSGGCVGNVLVRGPSVMSGYLGRAAATREVLRDGWLDTGDLGFELDGELYLCGRAKDVIVVRGRNYAPDVIERAAADTPGLRRGSLTAVPLLTERGDGLALLAERAPGERLDGEALRSRLLEQLGIEPAEIVLLEPGELPRTSSGKIRRREAARRHCPSTIVPSGP